MPIYRPPLRKTVRALKEERAVTPFGEQVVEQGVISSYVGHISDQYIVIIYMCLGRLRTLAPVIDCSGWNSWAYLV